MKKRYQVSIIICTYNSEWEKLRKTLSAAVKQQDVSIEIIISDDGSLFFDSEKIVKMLERENFHDYVILDNKKNVGTVRNALKALQSASGEYSFITSPGDIIYDNTTLSDFYRYAITHNLKVVFGKAVYYSCKNNLSIYKIRSSPDRLWIFGRNMPLVLQKYSILNGTKILGAAFFRETQTAIKYFEQILPYAVYVEDANSTLIMAINNERISFFNRLIIWYEYGSGISTSKNEKWTQIVHTEINNVMNYVLLDYSNDKIVRYLIDKKEVKNNPIKFFHFCYKYLCLILINILLKVTRPDMTGGSEKEYQIMLKRIGTDE